MIKRSPARICRSFTRDRFLNRKFAIPTKSVLFTPTFEKSSFPDVAAHKILAGQTKLLSTVCQHRGVKKEAREKGRDRI